MAKKNRVVVGTEEVICLLLEEPYKAMIVAYDDGSVEVYCGEKVTCGSQCQYQGLTERGDDVKSQREKTQIVRKRKGV